MAVQTPSPSPTRMPCTSRTGSPSASVWTGHYHIQGTRPMMEWNSSRVMGSPEATGM